MAVLLLGATGLIGSAVAARLARDGLQVVGVATWWPTILFTATAVVARPVTGLLLARTVGYPLTEGWIVASIALYLLTGAFWLPVVWMQARMRDLAIKAAETGGELPAACHRLFRWWFAFGFPAFAAVLAIFWLMISRPSLGWATL